MRKLLVIIVVLLAVLGGACGGNDSPTTITSQPDDETSRASAPASGDDIIAGGDCQDATQADGPGDLEMQDNVFAPPCLQVTTEQGLRIHNEGSNEHNFSVEGVSGIDVDVSPGDENNTEATGLLPGTFTFFCKYHRESDDMEGKLVVEKA